MRIFSPVIEEFDFALLPLTMKNGPEMEEFLTALHELVQPYLQESAPLRKVVGLFASWLQAEADIAELGEGMEDRTGGSSSDSPDQNGVGVILENKLVIPDRDTTEVEDIPAQITHVVPLKLGTECASLAVSGTADEIERAKRSLVDDEQNLYEADGRIEYRGYGESAPDLTMLVRRARLKAEACRVFIARRAAIGDPINEPALIHRIDEMIAEAKSIEGCFLWVLWRDEEQPSDAMLRTAAECYDALAEASELIVEIDGISQAMEKELLEDAFLLLAEADSALRVILEESWLNTPDRDQNEAHLWLRRESKVRAVYISRFMKMDDPGDPNNASDIRNRISLLKETIHERIERRKAVNSRLKKIQYHMNRLSDCDLIDADNYDAVTILNTIDSLLEIGIQPSDRRFRTVLDHGNCLRLLEVFDEYSPESDSVLRWVRNWHDKQLGEDEESRGEEAENIPVWSERVEKVRELIRGRSVVVVGGDARQEAIERIRSAFDLSEVVWMGLVEHSSAQPLKAPIIRPEVALVIVLVKLAGHDHVEHAVKYAREADKPCVLLRAGYNPEQIANQVLLQVEDQLMILQSHQP